MGNPGHPRSLEPADRRGRRARRPAQGRPPHQVSTQPTPLANLHLTLLDKVGRASRQLRRQHRDASPNLEPLERVSCAVNDAIVEAASRGRSLVAAARSSCVAWCSCCAARSSRGAQARARRRRQGGRQARRSRAARQARRRERAGGRRHDRAALGGRTRRSRRSCRLLIRAGANVKAANRYGVTPLSLACDQRQRGR